MDSRLEGRDAELERARHEPVLIVPYDPSWPQRFEEQRRDLLSAFGSHFVAIEHFGSTAVPGLAAKPIVDMLGGMRSVEDMDALIPLLCAEGYSANVAGNAKTPRERALMFQRGGRRTHHLILVIFDSEEWSARLRFRDALRADPTLAAEYADLKRRVASELGGDRHAYSKAKQDAAAALRSKGWIVRE